VTAASKLDASGRVWIYAGRDFYTLRDNPKVAVVKDCGWRVIVRSGAPKWTLTTSAPYRTVDSAMRAA